MFNRCPIFNSPSYCRTLYLSGFSLNLTHTHIFIISSVPLFLSSQYIPDESSRLVVVHVVFSVTKFYSGIFFGFFFLLLILFADFILLSFFSISSFSCVECFF